MKAGSLLFAARGWKGQSGRAFLRHGPRQGLHRPTSVAVFYIIIFKAPAKPL